MSMHNPQHHGEIIKEFCIEPLDLTITKAAESLGVTRKTFSMLLNGKSGISPEMALRLSKVFGRTPEGWLRLQLQIIDTLPCLEDSPHLGAGSFNLKNYLSASTIVEDVQNK
jgi:antitoxin HigA-1